MPGGELAARNHVAHVFRQLHQPQRVRHMRTRLADHLRQVVLRILELLDQLGITHRLLERIEVDTLHVLDDGELERFLVGNVAHQHRHLVEARALAGSPAAFAGDDLELVRVARRPHQQRLHDAFLADRVGQVLEFVGVELMPRVGAVGDEKIHRQAAQPASIVDQPRTLD